MSARRKPWRDGLALAPADRLAGIGADLVADHETRRFACLIAANPRQSTGAIQ